MTADNWITLLTLLVVALPTTTLAIRQYGNQGKISRRDQLFIIHELLSISTTFDLIIQKILMKNNNHEMERKAYDDNRTRLTNIRQIILN